MVIKIAMMSAGLLLLSAAATAATATTAIEPPDGPRRTLIVEHAYDQHVSQLLRSAATDATSVTANRTAVVAQLRAHAERTHSPTVALLERRRAAHAGFRSFWICNCISVTNASEGLELELKALVGDANVRWERFASIPQGEPKGEAEGKADLEWNIKVVAADKVWAQSGVTGQGIVVGTIDTGVRYTHEALRDHYRRGDHSWLDAEGEDRWPNGPSETPFDNNGHGTHVAGSLSGSHGIGVAPGADWITCKGFDASGRGTERHILQCAEFMACPTRWDGTDPDCEAGPQVLSNSWGFSCGGCTGVGDPMQRMTEAWRALGIYVTFAAGNSGPACGTATSPADLHDVLSVGGVDFHDSIAGWSSKGPPVDPDWPYGRQKPEIAAPGQGVRSAGRQTDTQYSSMSGSSMAAPHAAGAVALVLSGVQGASIGLDQLTKLLMASSDHGTLATDRTCGGVPDSEFPNYSYGAGRLNACRPLQDMAPDIGLVDCSSPGPPGQDDCYCTDACEAMCNTVAMSCCCGAWNQCFCSENPGCCPMNAGMPCEEWSATNTSQAPAAMHGFSVSTWDK